MFVCVLKNSLKCNKDWSGNQFFIKYLQLIESTAALRALISENRKKKEGTQVKENKQSVRNVGGNLMWAGMFDQEENGW